MEKKFLEKCFALTKAISIMVEIYGIKQANGETLHEYWERFKELCSSYPYYQTNDQALVQYFFSGLTPLERNYVDVVAEGALGDKTPTEARAFIARMGENT